MPKLLVLTYIPSPYQVELFNAIALSGKFNLQVAYLYARCEAAIASQWQQFNIKHNYLILNDCPEYYQQLEQNIDSSDLIIFNYYRHPRISNLIAHCISFNKPWCFWGERPGFKHSGLLGKLYRRWKLAKLHQSSVAIWGVGTWGVEGYRREFGDRRSYFNLPYFSDLSRFPNSSTTVSNSNSNQRVFLYSGALIKRKGVDLLAAAFCRLAEQFKHIRLHLLGEGDLRRSLEHKLTEYHQQVQFFGFQSWDKLPYYYQQADILCVPSRYDGWGLVVPEGLAAGLPVISTRRTGAAIDLIKDGSNGWLIDTNDSESLYQAMYQAVTLSPSELANYSQAASDRALEHSLEHGVQRFQQAATETIKEFYIDNSPKQNNIQITFTAGVRGGRNVPARGSGGKFPQ
ncbi:glycosyltransferase family 4 protein [Pleurocapsa sp. PCC 7319]|uniref:glycosyltransferase family 4 protein n=1 Tax=Pleurocapsa sp. PCC 7319 TaxID=118161 RepID=UPI000344EADB|nr:glycosyltransferase family 4 protein [Pleurocapsa sp. PCC 7319]